VVILLAGAAVVVLIGIPILAQSVFGPPSQALTVVQKIQYSSQVLLARDSLTKTRYSNTPQQEFTINLGETINEIANRLENAGLISDAGAFRTISFTKGMTRKSNPVRTCFQLQAPRFKLPNRS